MGRIIGIDLGTTTSEVAYIKNGKPEIIHNDLGERITPSVVGLNDDDEIIVGTLAKRQLTLKKDRTIAEVKRFIGENKSIKLGERFFSPELISSMTLKKLKKDAEEFFGEEVTEAVITVPANFTDLQRQATKEAGELAGLKVDRIINEPTAAALAYGINNLDVDEKVLVYDLGGGTFDITVLELFEGILDVSATDGILKLGGTDFDERIEKYIIDKFMEKYDINLTNNKQSLARIKEAAERAKVELSSLETTNIQIPFIAMDKSQNPLEVDIKLTRSKFEELIMDLVKQTDEKIDDVLMQAKCKAEDIDVILAVGGSSRIPCIKRMLKSKFGNKVKTDINPDEAVAMGAAIQAGIKNDEISSEDSILITDVCRYTLGTSVVEDVGNGRLLDGVFDPIILKNSKIPCTEKKKYLTMVDNQTEVIIQVYQGEKRLVCENTKIGEFTLDGIPEALAEEEGIEIEFTYNLNGILEVTAKVLSTGKEIKGIVDTQGKVEKIEGVTLENWGKCRLANKAKNTIELCERKINKVNDLDRNKLILVLEKLKKAIINDNDALVEKYDEELTDLLFDIS